LLYSVKIFKKLLEMSVAIMIDMHCHILPKLDDGADSLADSIAMARTAVQDGITEVIATPHHANGRYHNEAFAVIRAVEELNLQLHEQQIPLKVWPGQEIRVYQNLINDLERGIIISLNQSRYTLIEFPSDKIPSQIEEYIHELNVIGKVAIIAHPERNQEIIRNPDLLFQLIRLGALSQITAGAVSGGFGTKIQSLAFKLCEANLVHFIASDAHNTTNRPFGLAVAYQMLSDRFGKEHVEHYQMNARAVVNNHPITIKAPIQKKQSILDRIFSGFKN
jgi:protein-tyrosine phosphatase